jgi:hypothetical protein
MVEKLQVIVARHAKQMIGSTIIKTVQQVIGDAVWGTHEQVSF